MAANRPNEIVIETSLTTVWEPKDGHKSAHVVEVPPTPPAPVRASAPPPKRMGKFFDGFKPHPDLRSVDMEEGMVKTTKSPLSRGLRGRHLQMIAIGGSIGSGLFVGSGSAIAVGGQGSVIIAYSIIGFFLYCTMQALGELSALFPVTGSFVAYSARFIDPAWGFAMGWNYAIQWLVVLPLELVSASLVLEFWGIKDIRPFTALFLGLIAIINFFGIRGYGEVEFILSGVKILATLGFIVLGVIINIGGGPYTEGPYAGYVGDQFWHIAAFKHGFKGFGSTFVYSALAFAGTEIVGLAAAETKDPRRSIPTAIKQVFWRIVLFYLVSLTVIGFLVSADDPRLKSGSSGVDARASPFVIAIVNSGIQVLPSIMNSVILVSVISVANSAAYGSTRTLISLANYGQLPKIVGYVDRQGRPLVAVGIAILFGLIGFLGTSAHAGVAFTWLAAISTLSSLCTWGSICAAHIRFRSAWAAGGRSLNQLPYVSQSGVIGSWIGVTFTFLIVAMQLWLGVWPLGYEKMTTAQQIENLFSSGYLTIGIVLVSYVGYKLVKRTKIWNTNEIDIVSGARVVQNGDELAEEERARQMDWPRWRRIYKFFC
ncbi:hypothetical protein K461DRAFT_278989 [Myriangium duriaei CBS 260.36]|uniref:Amino acid permease/ SLC12A domain-containing protein n=1 Tax=Myriangium duriaei CBS 260.36 TaxID=1168546 RepID=A0A9P4MH29_9PEZI|nr:hypothetical protein K461DRAFT_278989 [Myriangium duriaei CBS 260.36]